MNPLTQEQILDLKVYDKVVLHNPYTERWEEGYVFSPPRVGKTTFTWFTVCAGDNTEYGITGQPGDHAILYPHNPETLAKVQETTNEDNRKELALVLSRLFNQHFNTPTPEQTEQIRHLLIGKEKA